MGNEVINEYNEGTQKQKKKSRYGLLRVMSFIIASAALAYKIFFAVRHFDSIEAWWDGNSIVLYFALYMTSLAAVKRCEGHFELPASGRCLTDSYNKKPPTGCGPAVPVFRE